jgi:hypothetical protein
MQIYVHRNNQQLGPFTEAEVRAQLASGILSLQDHAWWQGQPGWTQLGQTILATTSGALLAPSAAPLHPGLHPHRTSQLAVWSLVSGLFCFTCICSFVGALGAILLGHMGLSEIKRDPALHGRGMAITGLILGYFFLFLSVIGLAAYFLLASLGTNLQDTLKTITSQINAAQGGSSSSDDSSTNADQSTNAPTTTPPDSSTNSGSSTNAAPASQ